MTKKFKIGWQKYEDVIEKQLSSPMLTTIMKQFAEQNSNIEDLEDIDEDEDEEYIVGNSMPIMPISQQLIEELAVLSSFDCWMAHTNFDITPKIKEQLNKVAGVEVLKVCSRYRFFVGIGNMFNFSDVRKDIENDILPSGE